MPSSLVECMVFTTFLMFFLGAAFSTGMRAGNIGHLTVPFSMRLLRAARPALPLVLRGPLYSSPTATHFRLCLSAGRDGPADTETLSWLPQGPGRG